MQIDFDASRLRIEYDAARVSVEQLLRELEAAGYTVGEPSGPTVWRLGF